MSYADIPPDLADLAGQFPHWMRDPWLLRRMRDDNIVIKRVLRECLADWQFVKSIFGGASRTLAILRRCDCQSDWDNVIDLLISSDTTWPSRRGAKVSFPPQPFPDSARLTAVSSHKKLKDEARRMRHCCATYVDLIHEETSYFYHWSEDEEVTVELLRHDDLWKVADMKCFENSEPNISTRRKITIEVMKALGERFSV